MSITSIFIGLAAMAFPIAIEMMMAEYGFRGTLMLLFALNLNVIPAMAIMHPVEWHQMPRRRKIKEGIVYCRLSKYIYEIIIVTYDV